MPFSYVACTPDCCCFVWLHVSHPYHPNHVCHCHSLFGAQLNLAHNSLFCLPCLCHHKLVNYIALEIRKVQPASLQATPTSFHQPFTLTLPSTHRAWILYILLSACTCLALSIYIFSLFICHTSPLESQSRVLYIFLSLLWVFSTIYLTARIAANYIIIYIRMLSASS